MSNDILVEKIDRTAIVTINRPESRNSITKRVVDELAAALTATHDDTSIRT